MRAVMALAHHVVVLHHGEKIRKARPTSLARPGVLECYLGAEAVD